MKDVSFLLVDDSPIVKNIVKKVLQNLVGAKVVHAVANAREALKVLESEEVDFIIINWENPDISTNGLLYEVRGKDEWRGIPFVIMTSINTEDFFASAVRHGVTQCLIKPVTVRDLENSVRKYWNASSKRTATRFSMLPTHKMVVQPSGQPFGANIVNLSSTGCLLRLEYNDNLRLFGKYEFSVEFEGGHQVSAKQIGGTVMRLENDNADIELSPKICLAAVLFDKKGKNEKADRELADLVKWLESLNPETVA